VTKVSLYNKKPVVRVKSKEKAFSNLKDIIAKLKVKAN